MASVLLCEDGTHLLLEDGTDILLDIQDPSDDDWDRAGTYRRRHVQVPILEGVEARATLSLPGIQIQSHVPLTGVSAQGGLGQVTSRTLVAAPVFAFAPLALGLGSGRAEAGMQTVAPGLSATMALGRLSGAVSASKRVRGVSGLSAIGRVRTSIGPDLVEEEFQEILLLLTIAEATD